VRASVGALDALHAVVLVRRGRRGRGRGSNHTRGRTSASAPPVSKYQDGRHKTRRTGGERRTHRSRRLIENRDEQPERTLRASGISSGARSRDAGRRTCMRMIPAWSTSVC
jgi:hypothetical protein